MIVRRLRLRNFRSFHDAELRFDEGQNYIVGGNWQGKSSVVEGVAYALFGAPPQLRSAGAPVKLEHFLRDGASAGDVELSFCLGEHEYAIRRTLPAPASVRLTRDGLELATTKTRVGEALADLLAVDADFFLNVFYADQERLRRGIDLEPRERMAFVEELMGQENWRKCLEAIKAATKHVEGFLEDLASGGYDAFVEERDKLNAEIESDSERLRGLEVEIQQTRASLPKTKRKALRVDERTSFIP